jgi:hypothetical protein
MSLSVPFPRSVQSARTWAEGRPASGDAITLAASGTSHAVGTKVELFSETAFDAHYIRISLENSFASNTQTDQLVHIYVGGSGAEQTLIPSLLAGWAPTLFGPGTPRCYEFPIFIPKGSRLSAGNQALIASDTVGIFVELYGGGAPNHWYGSGVEALGAVDASSQGTSVTPGSVSEGTFTAIGTTGREYRYILPMLQGSLTDTNMSSNIVAADIGAGGAITAGLEEFWFATNTSEQTWTQFGGRGRYVTIPSGTALQLRAQNSTNNVDTLDFVIYGVY